MDPKMEALPPLKRFSLLQKQHRLLQENDAAAVSLQLPTKKRKESRDVLSSAADSFPSTFCLPAKKRVWALHPDWVSGRPPLLPFDLNVEFEPCAFDKGIEVGKEKERYPFAVSVNGSDESQSSEKGEEKTSIVDARAECVEISKQEGKDEHGETELEEDDGIVCAICESTDGDPNDPIVFCDGCDLMVHATCYGNPLIKGVPEGDWFCSKCLFAQSHKQKKPFSCCLCPSMDGALKPTKDGSWAHVVCALFVPEVFFEDPDGRDGIDCSKVPKRRWEEKCYVCMRRKGCVLQCSEPNCSLAFHITCGLIENLCIEYNEGKKKRETVIAGFCKSHSELWKKQQQTGKFKIVAREDHK